MMIWRLSGPVIMPSGHASVIGDGRQTSALQLSDRIWSRVALRCPAAEGQADCIAKLPAGGHGA